MTNKLISEQQAPIANDKLAVWDLVIKDVANPINSVEQEITDLIIQDMKDRDAEGLKRYGTRLQPFNGRDALTDSYQECLDCAVYLRQAIAEGKPNLGYVYSMILRMAVHIRRAISTQESGK